MNIPKPQLVLLAVAFALALARPAAAVDVVPKPVPAPRDTGAADREAPAPPDTAGADEGAPEATEPGGAPPSAQAPAPPAAAQPAAPAPQAQPAQPPLPVFIDAGDLGMGATVYLTRLPNLDDLRDLSLMPDVTHVVVTLAAWPDGVEQLLPLTQASLPEGADLIVFLSGYPPTNAAAQAWNYLRGRVRVFVLVSGPPGERILLDRLNGIRHLERVIADVEVPSREGFENLQRPLSYRIVRR